MYLYLFSCDDWTVYFSSVYKVSMYDRIFLVFISVSQILCICTYLAVMIGLYISPLFIKSPCVIEYFLSLFQYHRYYVSVPI